MEKIKIGITQGDINGIGYELILNTFETEEMATICTPIIYGSPKVATYHRKALGNQTSFVVIDTPEQAKEGMVSMINCFGEEEHKIEFGQAAESAGQAALTALDRALADLKEGKIAALVTSPLNNNTIRMENGEPFTGQTRYIEQVIGDGSKALKIFISGNLRIALVTDKMPVADIPANITKEAIAERLVILHNTLKRDFFIDNPRIAVLALNPQANGKEEAEIISLLSTNSSNVVCVAWVHTLPRSSLAQATTRTSTASSPCIMTKVFQPLRPSPSTKASTTQQACPFCAQHQPSMSTTALQAKACLKMSSLSVKPSTPPSMPFATVPVSTMSTRIRSRNNTSKSVTTPTN